MSAGFRRITIGMQILRPIAPAIKKLIIHAIRTEPTKSYAQIARDWDVGERTVRKFAKEEGIQRKQGRKKHPSKWTAAERREAFTIARAGEKIEDGLADERGMLALGLTLNGGNQ